MRRFDTKGLYEAIERQRGSRGITWDQVSKETAVSVSTIKRMKHGGRLEVDGMLAMVGWLGDPVEKFVREADNQRSGNDKSR